MYENKRILAVITARGGSKGLPGKNIMELAGKPTIAWTIDTAKESKYIDRTYVSTDDRRIAEIAVEFDAEVPFFRPAELATDNAKSVDVVFHAIENYEDEGEIFDIVVLLEPTSPLRDISDLNTAIEILCKNRSAESIVGISKVVSQHPDFLVTLENGFIRSYTNDYNIKRRQAIRELFFYEGSFYISFVKSLRSRKTFYHDMTLGYVLPKWKSFEIDDEIDFMIVERLLQAKENGEVR